MNTLKRKVEDENSTNQEGTQECDKYIPKKVKNVEDNIENNLENENKNICCICLDTIKENNNVKTSCNHIFCFSCLLEHLKTKNTCPCCRIPIEPVRNNNSKQLTMRDASNLVALNIEQNEQYIKHKIEKIKTHLIFSLLMNENGTSNTDNIFQKELCNITNSEIFNKTIKYFLLNELISLSAHLSINNINNIVEWLNH